MNDEKKKDGEWNQKNQRIQSKVGPVQSWYINMYVELHRDSTLSLKMSRKRVLILKKNAAERRNAICP